MASQPKQKLLFVCGRGKKRSPTAAMVYRKDQRFLVRFGGVSKQSPHQINSKDIIWADIIFVMGVDYKEWILDNFKDLELLRIENLDIPDEYNYMDEGLVELIRNRVEGSDITWGIN